MYVAAVAAVLGAMMAGGAARGDTASLEKVLQAPPEDARIHVRWWWFGPAVTKSELTREMQVMKDNGIGGFEVQPTYPLALDGTLQGPNGPLKNLKWMSPEFLDMLKFTGGKAKELGLQFNLTIGSGWPYGGPMVSASEGTGRIEVQQVAVTAGEKTVAFPQLQEGRSVIAAFIGSAGAAAAEGGGEAAPARGRGNRAGGAGARGGRGGRGGINANVQTLKPLTLSGNAATLPATLPENPTVVFFISGRGLFKVKRPSYGADGNTVDHLSASAVEHYITEVARKELEACAPNFPYSIFCDSLEVGGEDWTPDFVAEFQKRRGYDITPLLPALYGDIGPKTLEVRHDWGKTLTEVFEDNFNAKFKTLAHEHQSLFREQAYGSPSAGLRSYLTTDLPEGEGFQWHGYRATRYAASASHLMGVPVTSSETFTWLHGTVFRGTPLDIKAEADLHFIQGVNQLVCHGYPYTAEGAPFPGWSFYAAGVFDEQNPWYLVMPDVTKYLQRVSALLRQGQPANDVALYLADDDAWANFRPGSISLSDGVGRQLGQEIIPALLDNGYNMDFFDDGMLDARGKVDGGSLAFGEVKYKTVVLAGVERMPLSTLQKLEQFANAGGTVIATRSIPSIAPGYKATDADQQAVQEISNRLFKGANAKGIFVQSDGEVAAAIKKHLAPDVAVSNDSAEIGFIHRHTDGGELYFVANTSNQPREFTATFRATGHPEMWDAMTGKISGGPQPEAGSGSGGTALKLSLAPYESRIIVFGDRALPNPAAAHPPTNVAAVDLSTGWTVKFDKPLKGTDAQPVTEQMDKLTSWTENDKTKNFSGTATYEKTVNIDPALAAAPAVITFGEGTVPAGGRGGQGYHANLDGPVRDAAVVIVNGKRAGAVYAPPYRVDVTALLKPGENQITIEVANTSVNAIAAKPYPTYDYAGVTREFGNRFQPQGMEVLSTPLPSGLLGPVKIEAK
jgi:hypothetical protein